MSNRASQTFIVTTSISGASSTRVWDAQRPLALGHPFQWVIERTPDGMRVRWLSGLQDGEIRAGKQSLREITEAMIAEGAEIELPKSREGRAVSLRIRRAQTLAPAFAPAPHAHARGAKHESHTHSVVTAFACKGQWVLDAHTLNLNPDTYEGKVGKKPLFALERAHGKYTITPHTADLWLSKGNAAAAAMPAGHKVHLAMEELAESVIRTGQYSWRFGISGNPTLPATKAAPASDWSDFGPHFKGMALGLAAFIALSFLWPKPQPKEELVPAQVAKLILQSLPKPATEPAKNANPVTAAAQNTAAPKKVQEAKVVQAFRAQALSSAVSGLLKGGMTRLMAQSDFVQGSHASRDARRIFDVKNQALKATGPETGLNDARNVAIANVGGGAAGGKAGYGKGEYANVKGQGGSFVSMDAGGASVDEGLTKDEVGEVIHKHLAEVRYCYESAMVRTPDIEGKLLTGFVIGPNGLVKTTEVKQSTLPDPRLDDCILRRLMTWKFPNPRGGVEVAVSYPFIFKTLGR